MRTFKERKGTYLRERKGTKEYKGTKTERERLSQCNSLKYIWASKSI